MTTIHFDDRAISIEKGHSVLQTLLGVGISIPNSCQSGVCQSCMMQAVKGKVPDKAQQGLKDTLQAQNYFLSCQCHPEHDLVIRKAVNENPGVDAHIKEIELCKKDIARIFIEADGDFSYHPGQYISLWRDDKIARSYSLASVPALHGNMLELHIRHIPGGELSDWLFNQAAVGTEVTVQGPLGNCFYMPDNLQQDLILAGTGTGLAPLYGIVRDAVNQGHKGNIHLLHGSVDESGLYLYEELVQLQSEVANFQYHPLTLKAPKVNNNGITQISIENYIKNEAGDMKDKKIYLCGPEELVKKLRKICFLQGASLKHIYADAFIHNKSK